MSKKSPRMLQLANLLGGLGYILCLLAWLVASLPFLPAIISLLEQQTAPVPVQPQTAVSSTVAQPASPDSIVGIIVIAVAIIAALAVTLAGFYFFIRLPSAIAKTGQALTHKSAEALTPLILKPNEQQSKKQWRIMIERITFIAKLVLITLPSVAIIVAQLLGLEPNVTPILAMLCIAISFIALLLFCLQHIVAHRFRLDISRLW